MEGFNLLRFWRNAGPYVSSGVDYVSKNDEVRYRSPETDEETDVDALFFELELTGPYSKNSNEGLKFVESPKDAFRSSSASKPQSPVSVLKSSPRLRAFMLGFKKSKPEKTENNGDLTASPPKNGRSKRFSSVKEVPAVPLLSRDNSLRSKLMRESLEDELISMNASSKRFDKDVPKYLKLIKPLYTKSSKKNGEKTSSRLSSPAAAQVSSPRKVSLSSSGKVSLSSPRKVPEEKRAAGFKNVYKHLGRSRSEFSTAGMTPSPVNRRDDSLLQQHDIQNAILHCKRSFNSSPKGFSALSRCASDPSDENSVNQPQIFTEEWKRCSI